MVPDPNGYEYKKGGGCMVYQPKDPDKVRSCENVSACKDPGAGFAYCVPFVGAVTRGTCWYKQSERDCLKFRTNDIPENVDLIIHSPKPYRTGAPTPSQSSVGSPFALLNRWRVITCQDLDVKGCGKPEGKKEHRFGDPGELK
jgi:hypothetical protein